MSNRGPLLNTHTKMEQPKFQVFEQYDSKTGTNVFLIQEICKYGLLSNSATFLPFLFVPCL